MIRITQYREKCIGCNACVEASPFRWRISRKDGKCVLVGAKNKNNIHSLVVGDDELQAIIKASKNCPVNIIKIEKT